MTYLSDEQIDRMNEEALLSLDRREPEEGKEEFPEPEGESAFDYQIRRLAELRAEKGESDA